MPQAEHPDVSPPVDGQGRPSLLEAEHLAVRYGAVPAVRDVTLSVAAGEVLAVLGRNGAGKTTTLRVLAGLATAHHGKVRLAGRDMARVPAESRVRLGVALVPEGRGIFPGLTVEENLVMGAYQRRLSRRALRDELERVTGRFPILMSRRGQRAGSLSGGEQQMLAVARGLMSAPRVLLVDEPSLGLAPLVIEQIYMLFAALRDEEDITLVLVEQYVELVLEVADRAVVLEKGVSVLSGTAAALSASPELVNLYMTAEQKDPEQEDPEQEEGNVG